MNDTRGVKPTEKFRIRYIILENLKGVCSPTDQSLKFHHEVEIQPLLTRYTAEKIEFPQLETKINVLPWIVDSQIKEEFVIASPIDFSCSLNKEKRSHLIGILIRPSVNKHEAMNNLPTIINTVTINRWQERYRPIDYRNTPARKKSRNLQNAYNCTRTESGITINREIIDLTESDEGAKKMRTEIVQCKMEVL